ncbi:hypothetical protein CVT25_007806 [Psilocybe cyanescens]|uniref:SMODS and SLOG-associating 2TM effector domain-containing protein n=1 Tax=Psilocybe cyanescens TaxID=93625 RepID=A0A409XSV4_PSICY|nr:hypothetical protein CVT25_007806 [Psilocybe cyanescens]
MDNDPSRSSSTPKPDTPPPEVPVPVLGQQDTAGRAAPAPAAEIQTSLTGIVSNPPNPNPNPTSESPVQLPRETRPPGPGSLGEDERATVELAGYPSNPPLPPVPEKIIPRQILHTDPHAMPLNTRRVSMSLLPSGVASEVDWNPSRGVLREDRDRPPRRKTTGERLDPTLLTAIAEKEKYAIKARVAGFALNAAIGMQVVLGALTTGLSVVTTGHQSSKAEADACPFEFESAQTQIMTAILGGIATIVASYLARARGSNEPELSITRVKDLEQFIRECEAFKMDHGHIADDSLDGRIDELRRKFEDLLGNGNG